MLSGVEPTPHNSVEAGFVALHGLEKNLKIFFIFLAFFCGVAGLLDAGLLVSFFFSGVRGDFVSVNGADGEGEALFLFGGCAGDLYWGGGLSP